MINMFAVVHQNRSNETLLQKQTDTPYGPLYDLPHFTVEQTRPAEPLESQWQQFTIGQRVLFVPGNLLGALAVNEFGRVELYAAQLSSPQLIRRGAGDIWRHVDLYPRRIDALAEISLGPIARRLRGAFQNDELPLLEFQDRK